jgi:pimeloyl-ACP methyl ester carboxylesterase
MPTFAAPDGTRLAYRTTGDGDPLICVPGGPMQDSAYLGDLGGLSRRRRLVVLDLRGTGRSEAPADPSSYRCERQVDDVEALRVHLGLDRIDLLAHSGGGNLAIMYAARHPDAVGRLVLVGPSTLAVGIEVPGEARRATARLRAGEPWFAEAYAALERTTAGQGGEADFAAVAPFFHGRWDAAARAREADRERQTNAEAARIFATGSVFAPADTRAALATLRAPVLVVTGEFDVNSPPPAAAEVAALFPDATLVVQPGAGHFPWADDGERFTATVSSFGA